MHAFGLLNNSFQPTNEIRIARTLGRHRGNLVAEAASAIQRMQKALTEMNIQLANVLSDLRGVSGMKIIGAMLDGERDPGALAALVRPEVRATPQDIAKSLEGNWREELLFVLEQEVDGLVPFFETKSIEWRIESWDCLVGSSRKSSNWPPYRSPKWRGRWR